MNDLDCLLLSRRRMGETDRLLPKVLLRSRKLLLVCRSDIIIYNHRKIHSKMKQTVRTKNYNAVIQIPYEKLGRKSNCVNLDSLRPEPDNGGKTLVISNCNGCCQPVKESNVSMKMLEELEEAFESDMRDKDQKIGVLTKDIDRLQLQLTSNVGEKQKYKGEFEKCRTQLGDEQTKYLEAVKHIKYLDEQMIKLRISIRDKDSAISQSKSKQQKLLAKIGQLEQKEVFQQEKMRLLSENIAALENIVRNKQIEIESKLKFERQNEILNRTVIQYLDKISHLEQAIQAFEVSQRKYRQTIAGKDEEISRLHGTIGEYELQIKNKLHQCEQKARKIESLLNKIYENEDTISLLSQKLSRTHQMSSNYTQLQLDYKYLIQKTADTEAYINSLLQQIVEKKSRIVELQMIIKEKDNPKMYEVKIEKVIDRKDYIAKLQNQLENTKRAGLDLADRIKEMEGLILGKDNLLSDYKARVEELQGKILKLTTYIQEKQGSFAWVVEREIGRDIQLNRGEVNRTYKVYPSQPKPSYAEHQSAQISQQRSSYDNIILQPRIDSLNILTEIQNNGYQFRRIVEGEGQQRR